MYVYGIGKTKMEQNETNKNMTVFHFKRESSLQKRAALIHKTTFF